MNIFLFIIGLVFFFGAGALVIYWVFNEIPEYYFYRNFCCICGMVILTVFFKIWGNYVFVAQVQKWILFSAAVVLLLFIVFYLICCCLLDDDLELKHLFLVIPALVEVYFIIITFVNFDLKSFLANIYDSLTLSLVSVSVCIVLFFINVFLKSRLKEAKNKIYMYNRTINSHSDFKYIDTDIISNSRFERVKLERTVMILYTRLQTDYFPPSKVFEFLIKSDVPRNLTNRITERLFETQLYQNVSSLSLLEFAQELLPEYYHFEKTSKYRNSSMDMRMFEDLYDRFRRMINEEKADITDMKNKIEELFQVVKVEKKSEIYSNTNNTLDETSCQNQIRELFHALESPIATTEMALSNFQISFPELNDIQLKKIEKIHNNLKLIKTVLYAYRELSFMTLRDSSNAFLPLPAIIQSIKDFLGFETDINVLINGFPNEIPYYSTNLVTILILPLLQNALEATPNNKAISVNYTDSDNYHAIKISNYCSKMPSLTNLQTDGYSSKGKNHIGNGISIVRRVSNIVGINFKLTINNNQVIANLKLPKKK